MRSATQRRASSTSSAPPAASATLRPRATVRHQAAIITRSEPEIVGGVNIRYALAARQRPQINDPQATAGVFSRFAISTGRPACSIRKTSSPPSPI